VDLPLAPGTLAGCSPERVIKFCLESNETEMGKVIYQYEIWHHF